MYAGKERNEDRRRSHEVQAKVKHVAVVTGGKAFP